MVIRMLMAALLAAGSVDASAAVAAELPPANAPGSGAAVIAEARATIGRPVILQSSTIDARAAGAAPVRQPPRRCASTDSTAPDCRLIVYDLP